MASISKGKASEKRNRVSGTDFNLFSTIQALFLWLLAWNIPAAIDVVTKIASLPKQDAEEVPPAPAGEWKPPRKTNDPQRPKRDLLPSCTRSGREYTVTPKSNFRNQLVLSNRPLKSLEVASQLISFLSVPSHKWSAKRTNAMDQLRHWYNSWDSHESLPGHRVPKSMSDAMEWVSIAFFGNQLDPYEFYWGEHLFFLPDGRPQPTGRLYGFCGGYLPRITLDRADLHLESKDPDCRTEKLGTFLHECVHAFFRLHADVISDSRAGKALGCAGHGFAWVAAATYVEEFARRYINDNLRLGVISSMHHEYGRSKSSWKAEHIDLCHPDWKIRLEEYMKYEARPRWVWPLSLRDGVR